MVADIGLRLQEGIQDLKLEQQLAPAREAMVRTFSTGSTNFFKAVEGVRGRWAQRNAESNKEGDQTKTSRSNSIAEVPEVNKSDVEKTSPKTPPMPTTTAGALRPFGLGLRRPSYPITGTVSSPSVSSPSFSDVPASPAPPVGTALASWGAGIGSFISTRLARQPSAQNMPVPGEEKGSSGNTGGGGVEGKTRGSEERVEDEGRDGTLEPESGLVTPQPVTTPKINVMLPGNTTPVAGGFERTPQATAPMTGKMTLASVATAVANGTEDGVSKKAQVERSPKDVKTEMRLPPSHEEDKAYGTSLINSSPFLRKSKAGPEHLEEDPYPQRKEVDERFRDPFSAPRSSDVLYRSVHRTEEDVRQHKPTDSSADRNSDIRSINENHAYAGMVM